VLGLFFAPRGGTTLVFAADFNWRVILVAVAAGVAATIVFAVVPALQATRLDLASAMRAAAPGAIGGGSRARLRASLVLVQVSLSVVLLAGAGLMTRSISRLLKADPGFSTTNVATTIVNLFAVGYDTARGHRFEDELLRRAAAIGGVSGVALSRSLPFSTRPYDNGPILVDGYVPSRDELPDQPLGAIAAGDRRAGDLADEERAEGRRSACEVHEVGPRRLVVAGRTLGRSGDGDEALLVAHTGKGVTDHALDPALHGGLATDAEREDEHHGEGEARRQSKLTQAIAHVRGDVVNHVRPPFAPQAAPVMDPKRFAYRRDVAERRASGASGLGGRHAAGGEVRDGLLEVIVDLVVDVGIDVGPPEAQILPPALKHGRAPRA
jgi:hypothetical protein